MSKNFDKIEWMRKIQILINQLFKLVTYND